MVCVSDKLFQFGYNPMVSFEKLARWWKPLVKHATFPGFSGILVLENFVKVPSNIYLFEFSNGDTRIMYQICSKLTLKKIGWRYWPISVVFIVVIFVHILRTVLAFSIVGFEEVNIQSFKVNNGDTTTMFQTCSKLKIKKLGWCYWPRSGVFVVVNFEHIAHIVVAFPLLAFKKYMPDEGDCSWYLWQEWSD